MKNLFILAFMLVGSLTVASAQETVTFTYQNAYGQEERFTAEGSAEDLPCCGETFVYGEGGNRA